MGYLGAPCVMSNLRFSYISAAASEILDISNAQSWRPPRGRGRNPVGTTRIPKLPQRVPRIPWRSLEGLSVIPQGSPGVPRWLLLFVNSDKDEKWQTSVGEHKIHLQNIPFSSARHPPILHECNISFPRKQKPQGVLSVCHFIRKCCFGNMSREKPTHPPIPW